jgi:hypothetical protein
LTHSLKAPDFDPCAYKVKTWFQNLLSNGVNLYRYTAEAATPATPRRRSSPSPPPPPPVAAAPTPYLPDQPNVLASEDHLRSAAAAAAAAAAEAASVADVASAAARAAAFAAAPASAAAAGAVAGDGRSGVHGGAVHVVNAAAP